MDAHHHNSDDDQPYFDEDFFLNPLITATDHEEGKREGGGEEGTLYYYDHQQHQNPPNLAIASSEEIIMTAASSSCRRELVPGDSSSCVDDFIMIPIDGSEGYEDKKTKMEADGQGQGVGFKIAFRTKSDIEVMVDGFKWRKYGKKKVKNSPNPRNYYRCSTPGCNVKKRVEREREDPSFVITTYEGKHNHQIPSAAISVDPQCTPHKLQLLDQTLASWLA